MPSNKKNNISNNSNLSELYSAEVKDILGFMPKWVIRWGISVILILVLIVFGISFIVKFPDEIKGAAILTTDPPVVRLKSKASGRIVSLKKEEGSVVSINEEIAIINSNLSSEAIEYLDSLSSLNIDSLSREIDEKNLTFGAIQNEFINLKGNVHNFFSINENALFYVRKKNLNSQLENYKRLLDVNKNQQSLIENEIKIANERFQMQKVLFDKGTISRLDFINEQTSFSSKKKELEAQKSSLIQNQITITNLQNELSELNITREESLIQTKNAILASQKLISQFLKDWRENYIIRATSAGTLSYLRQLHLEHNVVTGEVLFQIIPATNNYVIYITIPNRNSGKIEEGQKVKISLKDYPDQEYGKLLGFVEQISLVPSNDEYRIKVKLDNEDLLTTHKKYITYKPEMTGNAQIITEDVRLIERLYSNFRKTIDHL